MATTYRIHPAIGVARVGNSPDEFFIGPERVHERPEPQGGFKDAQCRVKRQAARFRIFAHHDDGSLDEVTDDDADITWTVHLANKKAAFPGRSNTEPQADLLIDPGTRTATGPNQRHLFDTGQITFSGQPTVTVPLGEIRTDDANRLLVLGGHGVAASPAGTLIGHFWNNGDWYDDTSDGPVTASITLHGSGDTPPVEGAWVLVAPPKFAPHQDSPTTLYDRLLQRMIDLGLATAPTTTSYTHDIHPILQRARDMRWVEAILGAHTWPDPVTDPTTVAAVMSRINPPTGPLDMPRLNGSDAALTAWQYAHLQNWQAGTYTQDWAGVPGPDPGVTPSGLDRAALEACVGGAFFPGIEAGGLSPGSRPILEAGYTAAFRLDHAAVSAGDITASLALPWQADFHACGDFWWPVPRPNDVFAQGSGTAVRWARGVTDDDEMVTKWHTLGFVVSQGGQNVEVQHCDEASITLVTPHLVFADVPQGPMATVREVPLAITFEVASTSTAVTLEYAPGGAPGHPQLVAIGTSVTVGPTTGSAIATARLWVVFRTGTVGAIPTQTLTVRNAADPAQTWQVTVDADTVARRTTATALVLDRSGSMAQDRGDGQTKHVALQQAASVFVDLALQGDGVSVVRYNQDAQPLQPVLELGDGGLSDVTRTATLDVINGNGLDPQGATSIGDGIAEGRVQVTAAPGTYNGKALVVLTDGVENSPLWISDVAPQIDERTYAIGLGTPQNTSAPALQTISGNHGGFLLVTGSVTGDNRFLLQKYFLQVLAGISNAEVVLDPDGTLGRGEVHRIPFTVSDADAGLEVVLLTPRPDVVDFRLQTPNGFLLEPWRAEAEPGMDFGLGNGQSHFRVALPVQLLPRRFEREGTWHALLTLGRPRLEPTDDPETRTDRSILVGRPQAPPDPQPTRRRVLEHERAFALATAAGTAAAEAAPRRGQVPYSLVVHAYSNVTLRAELRQSGFEPGADVTVHASIAQSGLPPAQEAAVWMEVTRPDGGAVTSELWTAGAGRHEGTFTTSAPGVYQVRLRARGLTRAEVPWVRERTLTAAVWHGGDRDAESSTGRGDRVADVLRERDERLCRLLACLTGPDGVLGDRVARQLREQGVDLEHLRRCLKVWCADRDDAPRD